MRGWLTAVVMVLLLPGVELVCAQDAADDPAYPTLTEQQADPMMTLAEPEDAAQQLYEDVMVLRMIYTLDLGEEQLEQLVEINRSILEAREQYTQMRERTWTESGAVIEAVVEAWLQGREPARRDRSAADTAVNRVNAARQQFNLELAEAGRRFLNVLMEGQRLLVEDPVAVEERAALEAAMGGARSVGEWVRGQLDGIRNLMPEEFQMFAVAEAERMAVAIFGEDAPELPEMIDRMLDIIVQVHSWPPIQYQQQRDDLPRQIEMMLGIEGIAQRPPLAWDDLIWLVGSTRTGAVASELQRAHGGGEQ